MSELTQNYQLLNIIGQLISILGVIFLIYKHFEKADIAVDKQLGVTGEACKYKHKIIDQNYKAALALMSQYNQDMKFLRENHLAHIEKDIAKINEKIAVILDREERSNPKKI